MASEGPYRDVPLTPEAKHNQAQSYAASEESRVPAKSWMNVYFKDRSTMWFSASSEWLSSFLYMYLTFGTVLACGVSPDSKIHSTSALLAAAMSNGLALSAGIALGTAHGTGLCNPAVVCNYVLVGRMSLLRAIVLVVAQTSAALSAAGFAMLIFPATISPSHLYSHSPQRAFLIESIPASLLVAMTLSLRPKKGPQNPAAPVLLGFFLAANMIATSHFADGAVNPAKSLAISLWTGSWSGSWYLFSAPFVGSIFGAVLHEAMNHEP